MQIWTVPATDTCTIIAAGANGGSFDGNQGGHGAVMQGDFELEAGTQLRILVGQRGSDRPDSGDWGAPGGGGTFVVREDNPDSNEGILVVAGGGAGAPDGDSGGSGFGMTENGDGSIETSGHPSDCGASGGRDGQGGEHGGGGGSGAGFFGDGSGGSATEEEAHAFVHGGTGTRSSGDSPRDTRGGVLRGGFGGGGAPYNGGGAPHSAPCVVPAITDRLGPQEAGEATQAAGPVTTKLPEAAGLRTTGLTRSTRPAATAGGVTSGTASSLSTAPEAPGPRQPMSLPPSRSARPRAASGTTAGLES
eukprot:COSAG04_NODE_155_length_22379_cov_5.613707_20_plen_305_part_00